MSIPKLQGITHLSSSGLAVLADRTQKENTQLVFSDMVNCITTHKSKSELIAL